MVLVYHILVLISNKIWKFKNFNIIGKIPLPKTSGWGFYVEDFISQPEIRSGL